MRYNVVSFSTGKDSVPTALYARETEPAESIRIAFADTGNEHELVYEYLDYFERVFGFPVQRLKADFTAWWWHRRTYVAEKWPLPAPKKGFPNGVPAQVIERVLAVFDKGPTGNPYLDLCIIKGRFPSRRAQFCTDFLKTRPLTEYHLKLLDETPGNAVWSWQGVRFGESGNRAHLRGTGACAKAFEDRGGGLFIHRPIVRWKAADCFEAMAYFGIKPNPLYAMGMKRVGCMPCINSGKDDVLEVSKRFPHHVDRIEEWEAAVSAASKRGDSSFFPAPDDGRGERVGRNIRAVVRWAHTSRGGKQTDMMRGLESPACASSYGLCDTVEEAA